MRVHAWVLSAVFAALLPSSARAATMVALSAGDLAGRADLVVVAHARRFEGFHEGTRIHTQVGIDVGDVLRDHPARRDQQALSLKVPGGVVHDNAQTILGMPEIPAEVPLVFFLLWPRSHTGEWEVVGLCQGIWEVDGDPHRQPAASIGVRPLGSRGGGAGQPTTLAGLRAIIQRARGGQ